jgi:hypothetical protein
MPFGDVMSPDQKRAADVLVQWREVERAMEDPAVGEVALEALRADAAELQTEYERLVAATATDLPQVDDAT